ncbi:hypothetical protein [Nocardia wallacei]|uniref:hypothetical protein n=1 Tax=Nocardia wallacei TaxID=480035 RepID=UPI002458E797|nr:hypothetical protein [Nocardia wallacei]
MFLLRRNLPWAWAGWIDDFNRPVQNPIRQPWKRFGSGGGGDLNALQELHIQSYGDPALAGGVSYEFEPFSPNYGFEAEIWFPATGIVAQSFWVYLMNNWAKIGGSLAFKQITAIGCVHQVADGDTVKVYQIPNLGASGDVIGSGAAPTAFNGNYFRLKFFVEADRWVRCWMNDIFVCQAQLSDAYKTSPGHRGLNLNALRTDAWVRWVKWFDRPSSLPPAGVWQSIFYDDFAGASGNLNGVNGWTQLGANAGVTSGWWATSGTDDGSRAIIRDTGLATGRMRVEGTIRSPNSVADCSLYARVNGSGGTQAVAANIYSNKVYISRLSGSMTSPSWSDYIAVTSGISIGDGDRITFSVYGDVAWIEQNGTPIAYAGNINAAVPVANSWAGARVSRASFNNSGSWDDIRIYSGL